ncbi:NAD(P)H-dependent flavin oxidoreductase [Psychrobacter aestuarii]|nr:nitronate monooxygenase [Psychrobacter aestuarii]
MSLMTALNIDYPIIQAPMAGGATTPELVATVSNFGALGALGAGMTAPKTLAAQIDTIKRLTQRPFMVNLMVLSHAESTTFDAPMPDWLREYYQTAMPDEDIDALLPEQPAPLFAEQLDVLYRHPVPVASFTFGIISREAVQGLQALGTRVIGTANHPKEALAWAEVGADAVCVQGAEAGGHRGGWLTESMRDPMPLLPLLEGTRALTEIPLIATGGLMSADDIRTVLDAGAAMAQLGTAFLTTDKSGIHPTYKQGLLAASRGTRSSDTRLTRLFSGKMARGLVNDYMQSMARFDDAAQLPAYPQLNAMTKPMRAHAAKIGDAEHLSLWAGQGVREVKDEPTTTLLTRLVEGLGLLSQSP